MPSNARNLADQASNLITISTGGSNFVTPEVLSASISAINYEEDIMYGSASPVSASTGTLWVDSSGANPMMKVWDGSSWDSLGSALIPIITEIIPENIIYSASAVMIINGQNFQSGATVKFIANDNTETSSPLVVFNNSSFLTVNVPVLSASAGPYDVKVINPDNSYYILNNSLNTGNTPVWSTSAGVVKTTYDSQRSTSASVSVLATDPDGQNITYTITDGSVPTGMSFSSLTGILTGTPNAVANDTTYSFTIRASDGINYSDRSFSYIVKAPVITSFTSVGNTSWTAPFSGNIRVLVVAGGGGGGCQVGGGGGAGGLVHNTSFAVTSSQSYTVTVGAGGGGTTSTNSPGGSGGNSVFGSISAIGGSGGGSHGNNNGGLTTGGSGGGGGGGNGGSVTGANGTVGQGNAGGNGLINTWAGGGGGGAGGPGSAASSANDGTGGNGGAGLSNDITGSTVYYAGGGGGCSNGNTSVLSSGGVGGGAGGWSTSYRPGTVNATANTGGGGGGVRDYPSSNGPAGNGGSGIVIVRY
jgi:hypothetical protein